MLSPQVERSIEEMIAKNGIVTSDKLAQVKLDAAKSGKSLIETLVDQKFLTNEDATKIVAVSSHIPASTTCNRAKAWASTRRAKVSRRPSRPCRRPAP